MIVEKRTKEIYDEILEIHNDAFQGVERAPEEVLKGFVRKGVLFVKKAFDNGAVIGYAVVTYNDAGAPWLWNIAVDKFCRGTRVGQKLMDEVVDFVRGEGHKSLRLSVNAANTGAIRFYLWNGFKVTGFRIQYYGPDDGLFMEKELC